MGEYGLKQRVITGIIAALIFIGMLLWGGYAYALLIVLLALIGYHEYAKLNRIEGAGSGTFVGYLGVLIVLLPLELLEWNIELTRGQNIWFILLALFVLTVFFKGKADLHKIAVLFTGVIYIGYGFHYMIATRVLLEDGLLWSLFIFGCIWLTDTGAYFSGMLLGRHPLAPSISPNKTIEGAVGGVLVSVLFALGFAFFSDGWINYGSAAVLAVVIAVLGQLGDLIQSAYKRMQGVKDSGTIFPGHGGVLDRVDSWLIVFPAIHMLGLV